jgi:DNA-binding beta-propeller fold protein YncE
VGSEGEGPGQFNTPHGAAFNRMGELYVSDFELDRIQVFDRAGAYLRGFGGSGRGVGHWQFRAPSGLAFTPGGNLIVCDHGRGNNRVQVLRDDGKFMLAFGGDVAGQGMLECSGGVAVGGDGRIAVVDEINARVQVFHEGGGFVARRWQGGWQKSRQIIDCANKGHFVTNHLDWASEGRIQNSIQTS